MGFRMPLGRAPKIGIGKPGRGITLVEGKHKKSGARGYETSRKIGRPLNPKNNVRKWLTQYNHLKRMPRFINELQEKITHIDNKIEYWQDRTNASGLNYEKASAYGKRKDYYLTMKTEAHGLMNQLIDGTKKTISNMHEIDRHTEKRQYTGESQGRIQANREEYASDHDNAQHIHELVKKIMTDINDNSIRGQINSHSGTIPRAERLKYRNPNP